MPNQRSFSFVQLDVFASRPLEGNPLAVFTDGRGLTDTEMQAVAREMNLSETTFILPREPHVEREHGTRVRIFTVTEELPFAGHPTLGTAAVIRAASGIDHVCLQLGVGMVPVSFRPDAEGTYGEMCQRDPEFGAIHDPDTVAAATGVPAAAIARDVPIQTVSTGVPFTIVPMRDLAAIRDLRVDLPRAAEYLKDGSGGFFYWVTRETVNPEASLHARMIFYAGDDPATGSAAGCCASWAVAHGWVASGQKALIEQGLECNRASSIFVRAERRSDQIVNVHVGGHTVEVARGELFI
jgi:trans-2,3-dihydro-3-hydroxyanthranilate isomerase